MTEDERTIAQTASRLCSAALPLVVASLGLALVGFAALAFVDQDGRAAWAWWIVALIGPAAAWHALRLRFDAAVFAHLAASADVNAAAAAFDVALATLSARAVPPARAIADRARGARRLLSRLVILAAVQFAAALVAVFPG